MAIEAVTFLHKLRATFTASWEIIKIRKLSIPTFHWIASRISPVMPKNTWISLRQFIDQATAKTGYDQIDQAAQRLLEWIINRQESNPNGAIFIQTVVLKSDIASPATIFKLIALLQQKKLISVTTDIEDARRKRILPTEKATEHIRELSRLASDWAKKNA